jgi:hypothetical protein
MLHPRSFAPVAALMLLLALGGCSLWQGEPPPPPAPRTEILERGDMLFVRVSGEESLSAPTARSGWT